MGDIITPTFSEEMIASVYNIKADDHEPKQALLLLVKKILAVTIHKNKTQLMDAILIVEKRLAYKLPDYEQSALYEKLCK